MLFLLRVPTLFEWPRFGNDHATGIHSPLQMRLNKERIVVNNWAGVIAKDDSGEHKLFYKRMTFLAVRNASLGTNRKILENSLLY